MLLKILSFASVFCLFILIFIGGYVSASGVGLTCPKWPLCPAGLVPMDEFIIEYFHRSVAVATSILIIVTMAFTLKLRNITPNGMKISSLIAAATGSWPDNAGCNCNSRALTCCTSYCTSWTRSCTVFDDFNDCIILL